ncbi:hypothetical protein NX059_002295 [Plenodomus lindquistii]|nr:hypothetical protein NX059_002295 [Plenodomus lindquistii]
MHPRLQAMFRYCTTPPTSIINGNRSRDACRFAAVLRRSRCTDGPRFLESVPAPTHKFGSPVVPGIAGGYDRHTRQIVARRKISACPSLLLFLIFARAPT